MGPAAGIALGLDRLLMLCLGAKAVQDVIAFSPRDDE
jgi:elongation factor P--beta-lysine ligase